MRMQVILDSLFARLGKKGEFRDWTRGRLDSHKTGVLVGLVLGLKCPYIVAASGDTKKSMTGDI